MPESSSRLRPTPPAEDHPLSPSSPSLLSTQRRTSGSTSISPRPEPGYFDITQTLRTTRHGRRGSIGRASHLSSEADLLGVGPSRKIRSSRASPLVTDSAVMDDRDRTPPTIELDSLQSLSKEEIAIVDTRFDLMTLAEVENYLDDIRSSQAGDLLTPRVQHLPVETISSTTPTPSRSDDDEPLFPPSPPTLALEPIDHPLRVLSRAVRELRETVAQLELENERLRSQAVNKSGKKRGDQVSIHDGLSEAISTSLTSPQKDVMSDPQTSYLESLRSLSPTPSYPHSLRTRSPAPTTSKAMSIKSSRSVESTSTPKNGNGSRMSWTGIWAWSGKKSRPRRGSIGSIMSQKIEDAVEYDVAEENDEGWRKGDGGSPPSFRAIFLATRIITPDPSSILLDTGIKNNSFIAYLAHSLVSNARDEGITARDPPGRRRSRDHSVSRPRAATVSSVDSKEVSYGDQALAATALIGRTLLNQVSTRKPDEARPSLLNRASSARYPTTAISQPMKASQSSSSTTSPPDTPLPSVELSSILPDESRPPTVLLSRQNLGTFFQSGKGKGKLPTATRFSGGEEPLTDRYGFIYDTHHASMLRDASAAGTPAPLSLNGHLPVEEEGWIDRHRKGLQEDRPPVGDVEEVPKLSNPSRKSFDSGGSTPRPGTPDSQKSEKPVEKHRHRSSTLLTLAPAPAKPMTSKQHLTVSARGSTSLQPGVDTHTPSSPAYVTSSATLPNNTRITISSLLDQLTDIHDKQQQARMVEWDAFLKKRSKSRSKTVTPSDHAAKKSRVSEEDMRWGPGLIGISQMGLSGKSGAEGWKVFTKLVRLGIPLAYRSDVWAECSGAKDAMVPGEYAEILAVHANDKSPVLGEIEKDVSRTFPGNVFFGGDGPGVAKLRRVLIAYSWHNPKVGYCQGMNMLAATLLLTHSEEEQAYWTLLCLIDRLLPADYFSPSLLASRADQQVLADLVVEILPKIDSHLRELGVDLASVTFGWFLSLFTDCLPVETLFRVWDVFFVEGHDTLFRVAIAILKLNETEILACDSVSDLFTFISSMTSRLWGADKLIALQHNYKPVMRHSDIASRCDKHVGLLQREIDDAE